MAHGKGSRSPVSEKVPESAPWVDHVYSSLRWAEGAVRKLHQLLEDETITDDLRNRTTSAISWIEVARKEAFSAFEKMGKYGSAGPQVRLDLSAIGDETKVKMLRLNAALIETSVDSPEGRMSYESLRKVMLSIVRVMKVQANEIEGKQKGELEGPPKA